MAWSRGRTPACCSYPASVSFSFLSTEHAKSLSVCNVSLPSSLTPGGAPISGGLYDPHMGPLDPASGPCATCGLLHSRCPGHCGRVDLPLPVMHPLAASDALKILRGTCFKCFYFRKKNAYTTDKVCELNEPGRPSIGDAANGSLNTEDGDEGGDEQGLLVASRKRNTQKRMLAMERIKASRISKCEHCGAHSPGVKKDSSTRFALAALPAKQAQENLANGHVLQILIDREDGDVQGEVDALLNEDLSAENRDFRKSRVLTALEIERIFEKLWANERKTCTSIWKEVNGTYSSSSPGFIFIRTLVVPPNKFRPPSFLDGRMYENVQNTHYGNIIEAAFKIQQYGGGHADEPPNVEKVLSAWIEMQDAVNSLIDSASSEKNNAAKEASPGIRQQLDRKEGLFRKNMMGKRVNYAARSVISPDPMIATSEIGVPPFFAMRLSYPEGVCHWNVQMLRKLVENGPNVHPGAVAVEDEQGRVINLASLSQQQRQALAARLTSTSMVNKPGWSTINSHENQTMPASKFKVVYRHMRDGDIMLVNRQPTLHKPGIMAHTVKVINTGQRTIRLHYANCSTYNADFDGDEINLHLPQDVIGRAEGYGIVSADEQYVSPTAGAPLRGLIQDHVVGAVLLTKRDALFTKEQYAQLLYVACGHALGGGVANFAASKKNLKSSISLSPPALVKPVCRWTGKQVLEAVVGFIAGGLPPLTFSSGSKIPLGYWGKDSLEDKFCFVDGCLVHGVFDKAQFGSFGLVHAVHEMYGPTAAGELLSALSRLMTCYLQWHGMTCGLDDMIIQHSAEKERAVQLCRADETAASAIAEFVGGNKAELESQISSRNLTTKLEELLLRRPGDESVLDMKVSSSLNPITSGIIKSCIPNGQLKSFPENCLSLMTMTGAKGSLVNFSQISSLLGQQELEGRRVPRMASGKTLPCFRPWDLSARSGGFIGDRFLSGLKPQEYYFHCMAGRDGLVDTTVKTSRSGYLQRCLVKNLETLVVQYDHTVRDCDGSVIQFQYGEDALDPSKVPYLNKFSFILQNARQAAINVGMDGFKWSKLDQQQGTGAHNPVCGNLPCLATNFPTALGAVSDLFRQSLTDYLQTNPDKLLQEGTLQHQPVKENLSEERFLKLMELRYMKSLASPGESVGVIAAQSIGEPSTQMTLNTFHFAGRGEANVTLGIPRLREILMVASQNMKTPVMSLPLVENDSQRKCLANAEELAHRLRKVRLAEVLSELVVFEFPCVRNGTMREYQIQMNFQQEEDYKQVAHIPFARIAEVFKTTFCGQVKYLLSLEVRKSSLKGLQNVDVPTTKAADRADKVEPDKSEDNVEKKEGHQCPPIDDEEEEEEEEEDGDKESAKEAFRDSFRKASYQDEDEDDTAAKKGTHKLTEVKEQEDTDEQSFMEGNEMEIIKVDEKKKACQLSLFMPIDAPKLLMLEIVEKAAVKSVLLSTDDIEKALVVGSSLGNTFPIVQTEGVNLQAMWKHHDLIDVHNIRTNDIHAVLQTYGVEAARACIASEVKDVFDAYGINVDARHLSLISDFMTVDGTYRAFSRLGIQAASSPILKMSFETATKFLVDASLYGEQDQLRSPSSRITLGQVAKLGTGMCDVLLDLAMSTHS